ncbi:tripartite tricarboxylate transporter TctB family protein [Halomonas sp. ML-15]|uniref:tripartite tricarboxylate transporter TctB family protein n=1 Tax=Halomonas sp. ML-15 TaxID=2773305 RepID=UPI0017460800|nr:tripartite tricarboxylate transporter TctB family protein [Halomonas sp. ML-15]MBD3894604.1 tripartite tricarboxylate transporter TctB family protein [Halomonas sp. ML-15]
MITKDRFLSVVMLLIVAILLYESGNIPDKTSWQPHGSAFFPRILLYMIAGMSLLIFVKSLVIENGIKKFNLRDVEKIFDGKAKCISVFAFFGIYALLLPYFGYVIATILFMVSTQTVLMGCNTKKKIATIILTSLIFVPTIYFIFRYGLRIWLP